MDVVPVNTRDVVLVLVQALAACKHMNNLPFDKSNAGCTRKALALAGERNLNLSSVAHQTEQHQQYAAASRVLPDPRSDAVL